MLKPSRMWWRGHFSPEEQIVFADLLFLARNKYFCEMLSLSTEKHVSYLKFLHSEHRVSGNEVGSIRKDTFTLDSKWRENIWSVSPCWRPKGNSSSPMPGEKSARFTGDLAILERKLLGLEPREDYTSWKNDIEHIIVLKWCINLKTPRCPSWAGGFHLTRASYIALNLGTSHAPTTGNQTG